MKLGIILIILFGTVAGSIGYGRQQKRRANLTDWAVGGRKLGGLIFWFMNAGEVYTTFAVLGISGYAWAFGAPAYVAFCSVSLSFAIGYWLMPKIWQAGRIGKLVTQADFFVARYDAKWLGVVVGLLGIAAILMYVRIQLVSLGLIVQLTLGDTIATPVATIIGAVLMVAFVFFAGLRSAAFAAGVKDVLMIVIIIVLCATVASKVGATSLLDIFHQVEAKHPGIGRFPGSNPHSHMTSVWLMTSALNIALGNWVFPHLFQMSYSAATPKAIRRNAIWQPLYSLAYFFIILLGFAALVADIHPPGNNSNAVLLQFIANRYPAPVIGLVAGTGFLLALAPGALLLLSAGSIFSRNVVGTIRPHLSDLAALRWSRAALVVFACLAVVMSITQQNSLMNIALQAYSAIGMLAPGVFLGFIWKRTSALGVLAGLVAGFVALLFPPVAHIWAVNFPEWAPGLIAMAINGVVTIMVSLMSRQPNAASIAVSFPDVHTSRATMPVGTDSKAPYRA